MTSAEPDLSQPRMLLVGGGGGLVGRALLEEFGPTHRIRSVHRHPVARESALGVEWRPADVASVEDWRPMLRDVDVVVNVALVPHRRGPPVPTARRGPSTSHPSLRGGVGPAVHPDQRPRGYSPHRAPSPVHGAETRGRPSAVGQPAELLDPPPDDAVRPPGRARDRDAANDGAVAPIPDVRGRRVPREPARGPRPGAYRSARAHVGPAGGGRRGRTDPVAIPRPYGPTVRFPRTARPVLPAQREKRDSGSPASSSPSVPPSSTPTRSNGSSPTASVCRPTPASRPPLKDSSRSSEPRPSGYARRALRRPPRDQLPRTVALPRELSRGPPRPGRAPLKSPRARPRG